MVRGEVAGDDARPEAAGGIEAAAGEEDADHFGDEEREPDADGRQERRFVLFGGQHEDGEDEQRGQEHLEEHAHGRRDAGAERRGHVERAGQDGADDGGGAHAGEHLADEAEHGAGWGEGADEVQTESYLSVLEVWVPGSRSVSARSM